jgi:hypothetical protein
MYTYTFAAATSTLARELQQQQQQHYLCLFKVGLQLSNVLITYTQNLKSKSKR